MTSPGTRPTQKIAVVSYHFPHYRGNALGAIRDLGLPVTFIGDLKDPYDSGVEGWQPDADIDWVDCRTRRVFAGLPFLWQSGLRNRLKRACVDVVIVYGHMYVLNYWLLAWWCRSKGIPCTVWTHGWRRREGGLQGLLRKCFYRLFDNILVFSEHARKIGIAEGFDGSRILVVYNSLNVRMQEAIYQRLIEDDTSRRDSRALFGNEYPVVVSMARLVRMRDIPILMRAAAKLSDRGVPVNLLLVGEGPEEQYLRSLALELGISVHFAGACYDEEQLARYFLMSDVTVAPGPVGLLVMHSFVYGVPVISNDDPSDQKPEWYAIEPGVTGDHFRRGDVDHLSERIEAWCHAQNKRETADHCRQVIYAYYNPDYQRDVFEQIVRKGER